MCVCVCVSCMCLSLSAVWAEVINIHYALCNSMHVCMGPHTWMFSNNCCAIKAIPFPSHGVKKTPNERLVFLITPFRYFTPLPTFPKWELCVRLQHCFCLSLLLSLSFFSICVSLSLSLWSTVLSGGGCVYHVAHTFQQIKRNSRPTALLQLRQHFIWSMGSSTPERTLFKSPTEIIDVLARSTYEP